MLRLLMRFFWSIILLLLVPPAMVLLVLAMLVDLLIGKPGRNWRTFKKAFWENYNK